MLEVTRQADYALRAATEIARLQSGGRIATATIAARQNIPLPFLAKIVSQLVIRGILETTRGASGGVSLARPASAIAMREVIEAIDGPIAANRCTHDSGLCAQLETCPFCEIFLEAQQALALRLDSTNLQDLLDQLEKVRQ